MTAHTACFGIALSAALLVAPQLAAVDFLRGDANGDGEVTLADGWALMGFLFIGIKPGNLLTCPSTADVDDNGSLGISDPIRLFQMLVVGTGFEPPAPWPEPGPDPSPDAFACDEYGALPLVDESAELILLSATVAGGDDRLAKFTFAVSSATSTSGFFARVRHTPGLIEGFGSSRWREGGFRPLQPDCGEERSSNLDFLDAAPFDDGFRAGGWIAYPIQHCDGEDAPGIPPGTAVPAYELFACLAEGTPAGEYPLEIEVAELFDTETGRRIEANAIGGTLIVESDVGSGDCDPNPPTAPPKPDVAFRLADTEGARGGPVTVPFSIQSQLASQGFSFSIDFDESVLRVDEIERVFERPGGTSFEFSRYDFNNEDRFPGNQAGVLEGYIVGAAIISLTDTEDVLPPNTDVTVLNFHLRIERDARVDETMLSFVDGAIGGDGAPVRNRLIAGGTEITPETNGAFVLVDARIAIVPDVIVFVRGDANGDGQADISDAVRTLGFLFLGEDALECDDAADADDDGRLDLTDAIFMLDFLFRGGSRLPPPHPEYGMDPTTDSLGCGFSTI